MSQRDLGLHPFQAMIAQWHFAEEWRRDRQGMNRRAYIVYESRQRQFGRTRAAANFRVCFHHQNPKTSPGKMNGRSQAIRAGAHHDGVI
jgi:hypothetical protein